MRRCGWSVNDNIADVRNAVHDLVMNYDRDLLDTAHKRSSNHRTEVEDSTVCGCFYCQETFGPGEIEQWLEDEGGTAFCPRCSIDSVIGSESGYPVTDAAFLQAMHKRWFSVVPQ